MKSDGKENALMQILQLVAMLLAFWILKEKYEDEH